MGPRSPACERWWRTRTALEREQRFAVEAERDQPREAYEALKIQVELAHRRLTIAKAERIDTQQLELEFAATLSELDKLAELEKLREQLKSEDEDSASGQGELAPRYWQRTRAALDPAALDCEIGWLKIPPPLDTATQAAIPVELLAPVPAP